MNFPNKNISVKADDLIKIRCAGDICYMRVIDNDTITTLTPCDWASEGCTLNPTKSMSLEFIKSKLTKKDYAEMMLLKMVGFKKPRENQILART